MKKIIINFSIWFGITLTVIIVFAQILVSSGLGSSILPRIIEFIFIFAFPLVGSIVQSIFIRKNYFQMGVISILFIGLITSIVACASLTLYAVVDLFFYVENMDMKQVQNEIIELVGLSIDIVLYFSIPCCVIAGISYAATADHK